MPGFALAKPCSREPPTIRGVTAEDETTVPGVIRPLIAALVRDLADGRYGDIERDGRSGRLTAEDLRQAVSGYGATLIPLPDDAFDIGGSAYRQDSDPPAWAIDQDLWTKEEGRSDLTLQVDVKPDGAGYRAEITDLHVL